MPRKAIIDAQGRIPLEAFGELGYAPGTVVEIIPTRAGTLIVCVDTTDATIEGITLYDRAHPPALRSGVETK